MHTWCGQTTEKSNSSTTSTTTPMMDSTTGRTNCGRSWVARATAPRPWSLTRTRSTGVSSGTKLIGPKFPSGILRKQYETQHVRRSKDASQAEEQPSRLYAKISDARAKHFKPPRKRQHSRPAHADDLANQRLKRSATTNSQAKKRATTKKSE